MLVLGFAFPGLALGAAGPTLAGSTSNSTTMAGLVSVAVSGNYAYTTAYSGGALTAVDISNPSNPTVVGSSQPFLDTNLIGGSNVAISGGYAFVVSKNRNASQTSNDDGNGNSLTILDIHTDPKVPAIVGTIRSATHLFGSYGIAVSGGYAYVAYQGLLPGQPTGPDTSTGGFSVIDLSTIGSPTIVANIDNGSLPSPYTGTGALDHATSVAISGHYAYVNAFNSNRITVIDISQPTQPKIVYSLLDNINLPYVVDLAVQNGYLYAANQASGSSPEFTVLDLSNPAQPKVVASLADSTNLAGAYRIRVRGNFAYESASSANAVAAIDISDPTHPRVAGSLIDNSHLHRTTGLDLDSTGAYVVANSPYLSSQSNSTYPPYPLQTGGPTSTGTLSVIKLDPSPIAVSITSGPGTGPGNPTTSTSASFGFAANDAVATVQCDLDGAGFSPCSSQTSQQYTGLALGTHTFTVQATDAGGHTNSATYTWQVETVPQNTAAPTIDAGPVTVGQTITVTSSGTWTGNPTPTLTYSWNRCDKSGQNCKQISGQTGTSYVAQAADEGSTITVSVTGTNGVGAPAANSAPSGVVDAPAVSSPPGPSISGTVAVGNTLIASPGPWSGYPAPTFSYQWNDCTSASVCTPVSSGGTTASYTVQASDVGYALQVVVTATNGVGSPGTASAETANLGGSPPQNSSGGAPTISAGPVAVGQTITVTSNGTWSGVPAPTFRYQWDRCNGSGANCQPIAGQSGPNATSYIAQATDAGSTLAVTVTGTNPSGQATATSSASGIVTQAAGNTSLPVISGTPAAGRTLVASAGGWSGYPSPSLSYQWDRCNQSGAGCQAIAGQTGTSYAVQRADAGATLVVTVTGSNSTGSAHAASAPTAVVTAPPANASAPSISGTLVQGSTLRSSLGSWTGYPAPALTVQWQRCTARGCAAISGATGLTYTLATADVGARIRVVVTASSSAGRASSASAQTNPVRGAVSVLLRGTRRALRVVAEYASASHNRWLIVMTLPRGINFVKSAVVLRHGVEVRDAHGRLLRGSMQLRHGNLIISLHGSIRPVHLLLSRDIVRVLR